MTEIVDPKYARQAAERKAKRRARRRTRKGEPVQRTCGLARGRSMQDEQQRRYESTAKDIGAMAAVARAKEEYERRAYNVDRGYRVASAYDDHGQRDAHVDE